MNERIGAAGGKAITLHNMAGIHAAQGDPEVALELYRQSLDIKERIGDARGKAATLANISQLQHGAGEYESAFACLRESAAIFAGIRACRDLARVLLDLGATAPSGGIVYVAQASWLSAAVAVDLAEAVMAGVLLNSHLGASHPVSLPSALMAVDQCQRRETHPEHARLQAVSASLLQACLDARGAPSEQAAAWLMERNLTEGARIATALRQEVEQLVPEDGWLFDRRRLG